MSQDSLLLDDSWNWFAVEVALKATVVLLVATGLIAGMHSASAALRHRIWSLTFAGLLLLPLLQLATTDWTWQILPQRWQFAYAAPRQIGPSNTIANVTETAPTEPERVQAVNPASQGDSSELAQDHLKEPVILEPLSDQFGKRFDSSEAAAAPMRAASHPTGSWLFFVWFAGVAMTLTPLVTGLIGNARIKRRCRSMSDPPTIRRIATLCRRVGLLHPPILLLGGDRQMPMTFGLGRPYIVMPAGALRWSNERFSSVVLHELAHIKRLDVPLQLIARVACGLYWFHPLAWWGISRMRLDRELSCDDCVLMAGQSSTSYSTELLNIAREHSTQATYMSAALSMARRSQLEGRLLAALDAGRRRSPVGSVRTMVLALLGAGFVAGLSGVRPVFQANASEQLVASSSTASSSDDNRCLITGVVLSPDNVPAAGAQVEIIAHDNQGGWNRHSPNELTIDRFEARADESGRFRLDLPRDVSRPRRGVNVVASAAGAFPAVENVDPRLTHVEVQLQLLQTKEVRVQLIDPVGNPVPDVTPQIRYVSIDGNDYIGAPHPDGHAVTKVWPTFSTSDTNGYSKANLPVSANRVSLVVNDQRIGSHRVDIEISDKPVSAVLGTTSFLNGKVIDADGMPIAGAEVIVIEEPYRVVRTDADGAFRTARGSSIDTLFPRGQSIIHVYPPADSEFLFQAIEWEWPNEGIGDAELTIELERGIAIEGQVVESGSGRPVVGAQICFEPQVKDNPHFKESYRSRFTGADMRYSTDSAGRFKMPVCPGPGHLLVNARSLDYLPVETSMGDMWYGEPGLQREYYHGVKQLELMQGSNPEPITIELARGKTLRRQVLRPDGTPATGKAFAASYLQDKENINGWLPSIPVAIGKLDLPGFDPRLSTPLFILDVDNNSGAVVSLAAENVSPDESTIKLLPCGAAKFRFVNENGEPLPDYQPQIHLIFKAGAPATHHIEPDQPLWSDTIIWDNVVRPKKLPKTDSDGRVVVEGLIPGAAYNLYYTGKEGSWDEGYEFKVNSGESTDVGDVVLPQRE